MDSPVDGHPRSKRHSKSCQRCQRRKQRCHGFPVCSNCQVAKKTCVQSEFAIELHRSSSEYAAFERIKQLEEKLAAALARIPSDSGGKFTGLGGENRRSQPLTDESDPSSLIQQDIEDQIKSASSYEGSSATFLSQAGSLAEPTSQHLSSLANNHHSNGQIAETVGFLSLGDSISGEPSYVGSSSGISLATHLGDLMRATVWRKALTSTGPESVPKPLTVTDLTDNRCGPPNDEMGSRIIKAYFTKVHQRYPILDRGDMLKLHAKRHQKTGPSPREQYSTFKLYMIYAIGSTLLQLTEPYNGTSPEKYLITAMQYISATRESHSIHSLEAMILLVLYNLRSPSNSGIWYFIGLAMRTSIDLGLHREAHYISLTPYQSQLRRRLFWSVYLLDRIVAISLGRPVNIADQDIDVQLPLDIDDTVSDNEVIARRLAQASQTDEPRQTTNLTMWTELVKLKRIESQIQSHIYRVDKPTSSLLPEIGPLLLALEQWKTSTPNLTVSENSYLELLWNKSVRLLIQPFLNILSPQDELVHRCLVASGRVCQIFKQMFQQDSYGHSFISVHSIFISGVTICYCLCLRPSLWTMSTSNDLRACSSALFVMAERTPTVRKYRDVLETIISSAMDFISKPSSSQSASNNAEDIQSRDDITTHEHQAIQSLLGLSSLPSNINPIPVASPPLSNAPSIFVQESSWQQQTQTRNRDLYTDQSGLGLREEIGNWTMEEPMFEFQWQDGQTFAGNDISEPIDVDGMEEMGDLQLLPSENASENVWAGDKFGLHMVNKLLSIDPATLSETS